MAGLGAGGGGFKPPAWKGFWGQSPPRVRIPPSPPSTFRQAPGNPRRRSFRDEVAGCGSQGRGHGFQLLELTNQRATKVWATGGRARWLGSKMPTCNAFSSAMSNGRQATSPRRSSSMKAIFEKNEMPLPAMISRLTTVVQLQVTTGSSSSQNWANSRDIDLSIGGWPSERRNGCRAQSARLTAAFAASG